MTVVAEYSTLPKACKTGRGGGGGGEEVTDGDERVNIELQCDGCKNKMLHSLCSFPCGSFPPAKMWVLQGEVVSFVYLFSAFPAYIRVCWGIQRSFFFFLILKG